MIININPLIFSSQLIPFIQINIFGFFASLSIIVFSILLVNDHKKDVFLSNDFIIQLITESIFIAMLGAKLLFALENFSEFKEEGLMFLFSRGGFSLLGSFIALIPYLTLRLLLSNIPFLPIADLIACYLPVLQAIARIGCFFVGCCHGIATNLTNPLFFVIYQNIDSLAPTNTPLLPAQLISVIFSIIIFTFLQYLRNNKSGLKPGYIFGYYLLLEGLARFIVDFARDSRISAICLKYDIVISTSQLISLAIICLGILFILQKQKRSPKI